MNNCGCTESAVATFRGDRPGSAETTTVGVLADEVISGGYV